jgi:hypothetical protein
MFDMRIFPVALLLSWPIFASGADVFSQSKNTLEIKSMTLNRPFFSKYDTRSFETPKACENFVLSEDDVLDFFNKAKKSSPEEISKAEYNGEISACTASGELILHDGSIGYWQIKKSKHASVHVSGKWYYNYYCEDCKNSQFYSSKDDMEKFRPIIKEITKNDYNGANLANSKKSKIPSNCKRKFSLSDADILELFNIALPRSLMDDDEDIVNLPEYRCYLSGHAILQNGQEAKWYINKMRRGVLVTSDGNLDSYYYYFCDKCGNNQYYRACESTNCKNTD